jgi:hypothetical protein
VLADALWTLKPHFANAMREDCVSANGLIELSNHKLCARDKKKNCPISATYEMLPFSSAQIESHWRTATQKPDVRAFILALIPRVCACHTEKELWKCVSTGSQQLLKDRFSWPKRTATQAVLRPYVRDAKIQQLILQWLPRFCQCQDKQDVLECLHELLLEIPHQ